MKLIFPHRVKTLLTPTPTAKYKTTKISVHVLPAVSVRFWGGSLVGLEDKEPFSQFTNLSVYSLD